MPIENNPISVIDSVGEDREVFKSIRLTSHDLDLIYDCLANSEFTDSPNGKADLERVNAILDVLENLPRHHRYQDAQFKMLRITILPDYEPEPQERDPEYEYEDREMRGFEEVHDE